MNVIVCGAGIAGLTAARCLAERGTDVLVLERAAGPRPQGYMIDFFGPGYDAAEAIGVLPRINELGYQLREMSYRDERGRRRGGMRFERFAVTVDGRLTSIMRPDLERALREDLPDRVRLRYGAALSTVDNRPDGVTVTLDGGERLDADLLIGADGIHSTVRDRVFGPESGFLRHLGFHTAAYLFDDPAIHREVDGQLALTTTTECQLGFYGLRDGQVAAFAVHRGTDTPLPADLRAAVRQAYAGLGWVAPRALAACPPSDQIYYDHVAQIDMPHWHRDRVVLVGDSAYAVSLLAGQGASLGITGGYVLAEHLHRAADDIAAGLTGYEQAMRPLTTEKQQAGRTAARWFLPRTTRDIHIRRAALALANLPLVNRLVAQSVAGKPSTLVPHLRATARPTTKLPT